jgi:hypothetical protein
MFNNANGILRVGVRAVTDLISSWMLVSTSNMTAWSFQPPRPHRVIYTLSGVTAFLKTEAHRNNF